MSKWSTCTAFYCTPNIFGHF